jgi:hypothetical protein
MLAETETAVISERYRHNLKINIRRRAPVNCELVLERRKALLQGGKIQKRVLHRPLDL